MKKYILFLLSTALLIQCTNNFDIDLTPVSALVPLYTQLEVGDTVSVEAREFGNVGQIEFYNSYILIMEKETGIHIVANDNPDSLETISFVVLPGVTDFVIKENYIIASLANHIITVDITSFDNSMITAMLDQPSVNGAGRYPHFDFDGRFECVDLSKGIVMGWERRNVVNPECQKLN